MPFINREILCNFYPITFSIRCILYHRYLGQTCGEIAFEYPGKLTYILDLIRSKNRRRYPRGKKKLRLFCLSTTGVLYWILKSRNRSKSGYMPNICRKPAEPKAGRKCEATEGQTKKASLSHRSDRACGVCVFGMLAEGGFLRRINPV